MKTDTAGVNRCIAWIARAFLLRGAKRPPLICRLGLALIFFAAIALRTSAMVFTEDTEIGPSNTNYDDQDIVILDCTVTVDGPHTFSSMVLAAGGILTDTASANGQLTVAFTVTNAPYVLSGTTMVDELANMNIISPVLLTDTNGDVYSNGVDYLEFIYPYGTWIERTTNSSIPDGGTVLVSYSYSANVPAGLDLTVTGIVWVTSGCEIDADGIGYGAGFGSGAGSSSSGTFFDGSGGGYGGSGGMSSSNAVGGVCYGSLFQPSFPGSGGGASYAGNGGNGGGLVQITAGDEMEIDGVISANGENATNSRSGGGSGGSIWLSAPSISGSGSLSANGGLGAPDYGGGGGGGRIAIVCGTNNFAGTMTAYGGGGANYGGAGTVFTQLTGLPGLLTLDNHGNMGANSTVALSNLADVGISNGATAVVSGSFLPQNLTIGTNGVLIGQKSTSLSFHASNLTIAAGGAMSVNGLGSTVGEGGTYTSGGITYGGGGGHGGSGGVAVVANAGGGSSYDTQAGPLDLGDGGGGGANGGAGGGAFYITVTGALQVNGSILANGAGGTGLAGGGGAGGSVFITAGTFSGNGTVTANGGNGANSLGGGGGGGRIGIFANSYNFVGTIDCFGGSGANYGGAGTEFLSQIGAFQSLILDNGGNPGPFTLLQSAGGANLFVQDGAWGTLPSGGVFLSLLVTSNAWVTSPTNYEAPTVTILDNATFQAGGGLTLNSAGQNLTVPEVGGHVTLFPYACGGGGNGGMGGAGAVVQFQGIVQSGDVGGAQAGNQIANPFYAGANGGGYSPYSIGGIGGGTVKLVVDGALLVNGVISANGGNGSGSGGGGGAGGSLNLSAGIFAGSGLIMANGGNGVDSVGGGGGGGCIAIAFNSNSFSGTMSAFGGVGANNGGAGIIYYKTNSFANGQIIVDNGGQSGAPSAIGNGSLPQSTTDLTLRNDGSLYFNFYNSPGTLNLGNLLITNASLVISNELTINANNIYLQNGGLISANAGGYGQNSGPGGGRSSQVNPYAGSGGGNGGCGGMTISNAVPGGGAFGLYYEPTQPGGGGGGDSPYSVGGNGGGVIELNVSGTMAVNGTLSANGVNGAGTGGGGGAGGSLDLNIGSLTGSGVITANGGNGVGNIGGGGGGMVGIFLENPVSSNLFSGFMSAYGGTGATNGGAGTIFIRTNTTDQATLILDNDGNLGTNTPINNSSSLYSVVIRNGATAAMSKAQFSSLLIASNGWLVPEGAGEQEGEIEIELNGNATIQAGGGIIADLYGYAQDEGNGAGIGYTVSPTYPCSGAGHGGDGAFGLSNLVKGGITYDSISEPEDIGSGGGGYSPDSTGGGGGGGINISVNPSGPASGILRVNGIISANGGNGSGFGGGGGSGGSILLNASSIIGTGSIAANGGNGAPNGGGGGGGCISLNCIAPVQTNAFLGTISAYGGGGANFGGAGTLFYRTNNALDNGIPIVYLDNDKNVGTDTTVNIEGVNLVVQNGAIGAIPSSSWDEGSVLVLSNSELTMLVGQSVLQATSLTISTGGVFSVDGGGYAALNGPGAGSTSGGISGGGGHGGYGGGNVNGAGAAYDSIQSPTAEGSGGANSSIGPGGAGGGALTLNLTQGIVVNGRISANGRSGGLEAGGGAGGSVSIARALSLSGNGIISANGGSSDIAGGGAGGRIAVTSGLNTFGGKYSAAGGAGSSPGGAGTVFTSVAGGQTLLVNNGGLAGANTPLSSAFATPATPFELDVSGGAFVLPLTPLPLLSNLNVLANSTLTIPVAQSNFLIGVMGNATIAGDLDVDYLGYSQTNGPGAGVAVDNEGSGAGYGGAGGASDSGAHGGATYGSATAPTAFGSGGGNGADTTSGGSSGGGALRLSVAGTLNVSGNISANGDSGFQDDSGGGSGGSVWITAGTLSGAGTISASGGDGVLYGGGGGGGGRVAIDAPTNQFTGTTDVTGGIGAVAGQPGTISLSSTLNGLQILSQSPYGLVSNTVSSVTLTFSDMINPASLSSGDFTLYTPTSGALVPGPTFTVVNPFTIQLNFPTQNIEGPYTVQVQGPITDFAGASLTQSYSGVFIISIPTISGTVMGTNGTGVAGVSVLASGLVAATTDTNGNYSLGVPSGWTGTVTPSFGSYMFIVPSMSYTNISGSITNQNYSMVQTISPTLATRAGASNFSLNWNGISGVNYQVLWSTNLVTWQPLGSPLAGTNGPMQVVLPSGSNSAEFFQIQAGD